MQIIQCLGKSKQPPNAKQFLLPRVSVSGFKAAWSEAALQPDATLNQPIFTLVICLALFPARGYIRLSKSSVTYAKSNKRCLSKKGHRQEIGFLLLSQTCWHMGAPCVPIARFSQSLSHSQLNNIRLLELPHR